MTYPPLVENSRARTARRLVGLLFILLPLVTCVIFGLWEETTRPWLESPDMDENMMPLPSLLELGISGFLKCLLPALPLILGGWRLYRRPITVRCMVYHGVTLAIFGILLIGIFGRYSFAPGTWVPEPFQGLNGILLFGLASTTLLSSLLLVLGKEGYVRLCALLPPAILGSLLLLLVIAAHIR